MVREWISRRGAIPRFNGRVPLLGVLALLGSLAILLSVIAEHAEAAPCDAPIQNEIVCENSKPGDPPSEWDISRRRRLQHPGLRHRHQRRPGADRQRSRSTPELERLPPRHLPHGLLRRRRRPAGCHGRALGVAAPESADLPRRTRRPAWSTAATGRSPPSWAVPADAVSGIYFAKLVREDGTDGASHIFFVVRDDDGASDLLFQTSDTTWQAYNPTAATASTPARRSTPAAPTRSATTVRSRPAGPTPEDSVVQRRVSDGPLARAQRLRRQLLHRRRQRPLAAPRSSSTRRSCRSATTSTGRHGQRANVEGGT